MACEDCERRKLEENVDGLYEDIDELNRVKRNQGIALVITLVALYWLVIRLNDSGVLTYSQLLKGADA